MRSGRGEVQHDGFEYNWCFRSNNWHAQVGKLGAGAWVRRRRWVRLMMRPATQHDSGCQTTSPSLSPTSSPPGLSLAELSHVWDGTEQDWQHVHRLLKQLGRDGRKLELWRMWLSPHAYAHTSSIKNKQSALAPENHSPPLVHLTTILRNHVRVFPSFLQTGSNTIQGETILRFFVYPDSRAQFVHLVSQAGQRDELEHGLGRPFSASDVDFWSYADDLDKLN